MLQSMQGRFFGLAVVIAAMVAAAAAVDCPDASWLQQGDSCFKLIQEAFGRTQSQAETHCRELHDFGGLLWLDSNEEKAWVRRFNWDLKRQRDKCKDCDRLLDAAWVGLFREPQPPHNFYWNPGNGPQVRDTLLTSSDWFWHSGHPKPPSEGMFKAALTEATNTSGHLYRTNFGIEKMWHICKIKDPLTTTAGPTTSQTAMTEPTTAEPTTAEPTTAEPTTAEPTTAEPTTAEPTTAEPTTKEPTTTEPTTTEPTTTEPTTAEPKTSESTTREPTTTESTTAEPTTNEPTATEPSTKEPTTAEPTTAEATTTEVTTNEVTTNTTATTEQTLANSTVDSQSTKISTAISTHNGLFSTAKTPAVTEEEQGVEDGWFVSLLSVWLISAAVIATVTLILISAVAIRLRASRLPTYSGFKWTAKVAPVPSVPAPSVPAPSVPAPSVPAPSVPAPSAAATEARQDIDEVVLIT